MVLRCICVSQYRVMLRYNYVILASLHLKHREKVRMVSTYQQTQTYTHKNELVVHSCIDEIFLLCGKRNEEKNWSEQMGEKRKRRRKKEK